MLILASTTDKLRLITSAAGQIDVHASWMDNASGGTIVPGRTNTPTILTATTTDIVPAPGSGTFRNIKTLHVHNRAAGNNTVTVVHTDGTIAVELHQVVLGTLETLQYIDEVGFGVVQSQMGFTTGDAKITFKTVADSGWVLMNDGTIGDASSSSSTRAAADCEALFKLMFNNLSDAAAPLLTAGGALTLRSNIGNDANAAWTGHFRMTLPKVLGRSLAGAGAGTGLTARGLGMADGSETHTMTLAELVAHAHTINSSFGFLYTDGDTHSLVDGGGVVFYDTNGYATATDQAGSTTPFSVLDPRVYWNVMIKL